MKTAPKMSHAEAVAVLTAPGSPFEIVEENVGDLAMPVFKNRMKSLLEVLEHSKSHGDQVFSVWDTGVRWTFAEHAQLVASVAAAFRERHGIGPGSRVAILAANCPEWVLAAWATIALGGTVVAMNGWWQTDEILYGLELGDPDLLVADRRRLERLEGHSLGIPTIVIESDFAAYEAHAPAAALPSDPIDEDTPAAILFTSGTTGRPKGAVSTHRNFIAFMQISFASGAIASLMYPRDEPPKPPVSIAISPLFHVSGFQSCALMGPMTGAKYVWTTGRFDPKKIFRLSLEEGVTRWGGVPTHVWRLLEHPDLEPEKFRQITSTGGGGSVFSPELQRLVYEKLPQASGDLNVGYGLTECAGLCSMARADMLRDHPDTVGRALPTFDVAIFDDTGKRVPEGEEGNICIRGPGVMPGYWRNEAATREAFFDDGWLRSGDIGYLRDGLLFLASRKRDMIIRGGENVYPIEIENRLEEHPHVQEAAVVGVDHRSLGQEVKAIVVTAPGTTPDAAAIQDFVAETLAAFKVPRYVEFREEPLPRNASGKVLKAVLTGEIENSFTEE